MLRKAFDWGGIVKVFSSHCCVKPTEPLWFSLSSTYASLYTHEILGLFCTPIDGIVSITYRYQAVVKRLSGEGCKIVAVHRVSCFYSALLMSKMALRLDDHSCCTSKGKFSQHWKCCWNHPWVCVCVCASLLFDGLFLWILPALLEMVPLMSALLCLASLSVPCTHWSKIDRMLWCLVVPGRAKAAVAQ